MYLCSLLLCYSEIAVFISLSLCASLLVTLAHEFCCNHILNIVPKMSNSALVLKSVRKS